MNTRRYDPYRYECWGISENPRTHAKGCRKGRTLRWVPGQDRIYSVECSLKLSREDQAQLVRCVPVPGKGIYFP